jgi:hypothetical protein
MGSARPGNEKTAGVRTMALVALGSCTFTLVGYAFADSTGDSARVAAQIVADHGKASIKLDHLLAEFSVPGRSVRRRESDNEREQWSIHYRLSKRDQEDFLAALALLPESSPSSGRLQDRQKPSTAEEIEPWFPPEG